MTCLYLIPSFYTNHMKSCTKSEVRSFCILLWINIMLNSLFSFSCFKFNCLTVCGPSDGKEVKDDFGYPGACVRVGTVHLRPLAVHVVRYPTAGLNLETWQLFCLYSWNIAECDIKPQPTNQSNLIETRRAIMMLAEINLAVSLSG